MEFRGDLDALVLGVLQDGGLHGYEITRRINDRPSSPGENREVFHIREGQLYPILHRLEAEGRINAEWIPQEGKPPRKVYRLTDDGKRLLETKRQNWVQFVSAVNALLHPAKEVKNG